MQDARPRLEFSPGEILVEAGQPVQQLYLVRSGSVSIPSQGRAQPIIFGPGTVIGLVDIVEGAASPEFRSPVTAVGSVQVETLDAGEVRQQVAALSPRLRTCLVALVRSGLRILELNEQTEARVSRVVSKARKDIDALLDGRATDAAARDELDVFLSDGNTGQ